MENFKNIENVVVSKKCCGCNACLNICPQNAISVKENEQGFLYPCIDKEKCTHCGLCEKICPVVNPDFSNTKHPECFAAMAEDELRKKSSSGAIFPVLAKYVIENGGYVCGAAYTEDFSVEHVIINNEKDLARLKGSKYIQSNIKDCFSKIKDILKTGKQVLFTGSPCQVAGLKNFLQKDYENLFCVDLLCHGVPSVKIFQKYLKEMFPDEKIEEYTFRDKSQGWHTYYSKIKSDINQHFVHMTDNSYVKGFLYNLFLRESCYKCPFATIPRQGDITIGDFWGIENYDITLDDDKGTSVVLINNRKGQDFFKKIKNELKTCKNMPLKYAVKHNLNLRKPSKASPQHKQFLRCFNKYTFKKNIDACLYDKADVGIINLFYSDNYGAILTAYALQESIEQLGYSAKIINNNPSKKKSLNFGERFINKYLNLTKRILSEKDLFDLNFKIHTFITGSDQVFRKCILPNYNYYLLDFVSSLNKKIAFSASFGIGPSEISKEMNSNDIQEYTDSLKSFDFVSVREDSGVEICKKYFATDAQWVIDPVFMLDPLKYENIINNYDNKSVTDKYDDTIVSYILDSNEEFENFLNSLSVTLNKKVMRLSAKNDNDIEEWLAAFKNASYIVTDSFHGCCFAIIFNKPFICKRNNQRGNARFDAIINKFNISQSFISDVANVSTAENPFTVIDYTEINRIMKEERIKNTQLLKQLIEAPKVFDVQKLAFSQVINQKKLYSYIHFSKNKNKILLKYYFYSVLYNLCFSRYKMKIRQKRANLKKILKQYNLI